MNAIILYHTRTGHTKRAGEDIAEGLRAEGCEATLVHANEMDEDALADAAAGREQAEGRTTQ
jgi:menaquinone-dependent protoporphyrinogen IX oxidase